jgi:hypothetical protein
MDDWMEEVIEERESAVSLLIKSEEKLLASDVSCLERYRTNVLLARLTKVRC